jgi:hypothetical protein
MTFEVGAGVTLKAVTDPSAFPFVYARFEGTMRFGHAGLLNAGMVRTIRSTARGIMWAALSGTFCIEN